MADITLRVNGAARTGSPEARKTLADFLRDDLASTGSAVRARSSSTAGPCARA
jgi:aerobic-type carbon monoxide dehydrogenase small subunit (CoxS/CutS family)